MHQQTPVLHAIAKWSARAHRKLLPSSANEMGWIVPAEKHSTIISYPFASATFSPLQRVPPNRNCPAYRAPCLKWLFSERAPKEGVVSCCGLLYHVKWGFPLQKPHPNSRCIINHMGCPAALYVGIGIGVGIHFGIRGMDQYRKMTVILGIDNALLRRYCVGIHGGAQPLTDIERWCAA